MGMRKSDWTLKDAKIVAPDEVMMIINLAKQKAEKDPETWKKIVKWLSIAANSGLRLSEVGHIEKEDVLQNRLMMVRRKKRDLHPEPIEIMPAVHALLHEMASKVETGFIFPGNAQPCIIYRSKTDKDTKKKTEWTEQVCVGGHSSLRTIQRAWRILVTELNLYKHGRGIHSLRHAAITKMYKDNKDLLLCQEFAGHSSPDITVRYCHVVDLQEKLAKMTPLM